MLHAFHKCHIMRRVFPVGVGFLCGDRPDNFGGIAKGEGIVGNPHFSSDERASADDAVAANHSAAQNDAAHANHCVVPDSASVNDGVVSDSDTIADLDGKAGVGVEGSIVLYIAAFADRDGIGVSADNGIVPDTYIFADRNLSDNMCAFGDKTVIGHKNSPYLF